MQPFCSHCCHCCLLTLRRVPPPMAPLLREVDVAANGSGKARAVRCEEQCVGERSAGIAKT
jgi:hypothetical protein